MNKVDMQSLLMKHDTAIQRLEVSSALMVKLWQMVGAVALGLDNIDLYPVNNLVVQPRLLRAWREGDQHAGSTLFSRHYPSIYRFFLSKVPDAAEDLVQRTFLGCLEAAERFRGDSSVRTFLFGIAHNTLRHHLRGRQRSEQPLDSELVSVAELAPGPSTALGSKQEQRLLLRALRHVPLDTQVVLELHYWE